MNNCSRGGYCCVAGNEAGTTAIESEVKQGTVNGLNRTLFPETGDALSATLDAPKTSKTSLCSRICNLWLIRKIIGLFRRLFRSEKVVDSANEGCGRMNAKSSSEEQIFRGLDAERLPNCVTIVKDPQGIKGFIERNGSTGAYGIVNSIDESGQLSHGVGCVIKDMAGSHYAQEVLRKQGSNNSSDRIGYGQCATYRFDPVHRRELADSGSNSWQTIHSVLIPPVSHRRFDEHLENTVLNVLNEAAKHEIDRVAFPLPGCGRAGGTGEQLAQAVFAATCQFESRHPYRKVPEIILVSTLSASDNQACADFERRWTSLVQSATGSMPHSRPRQPGMSPPSGISSGAAAGAAGVTEIADVGSAAPHGKTIDCGNCGETTTKAESRTVKGMVICPDCVREFADDGVNLAQMDERYDAIQYEPFEPVHSPLHLPGYAGVGTITVQIAGRAPAELGGRELAIPVKSERAFFPDNEAGRELVRLFGILHKHKLIYVIDESRSLVCSDNSPLLHADCRNRVFDVTHSTYRTAGRSARGHNGRRVAEPPCFFTADGKKIFFASCTDEELQGYGIQKALGVTFNIHFKTAPIGPHGYQQPDGTIDYGYLGRVASEIQEIAQTRGLQDELCTDKILELLGSGAAREGQG